MNTIKAKTVTVFYFTLMKRLFRATVAQLCYTESRKLIGLVYTIFLRITMKDEIEKCTKKSL